VKTYIIYATNEEAQIALNYCTNKFSYTFTDTLGNIGFEINTLDTIYFAKHGAGIMHATNIITQIALTQIPDLIIQIGIAGSYNLQLGIGNVYTISADRLADVGAQDDNNFLSIYQLDLEKDNEAPYTNGWLFNTEKAFPLFFNGYASLSSITVNTASGKLSTINQWIELYKPNLETMEGAALHYVCLQQNIAFVQLRAISNYITVRDKSKWQIPLAITNLNEAIIEYIKSISIH
jgi:futalosine hydrolase